MALGPWPTCALAPALPSPCTPIPPPASSAPSLSQHGHTVGSLLVSSKGGPPAPQVEVLKVGPKLFTPQGEAESRKLLPTCMSLCWDRGMW